MKTLTEKELELLNKIKEYQNEPGHSDFTSETGMTKSETGVLGSLVKKGMVYDSYENLPEKVQMWCLSEEAIEIVGVPKGHVRKGDVIVVNKTKEELKTSVNKKDIQYTTKGRGFDSDIAKKENNDCVVRATSFAFDVEYNDAHQFCREFFDRKDKKGTKAVTMKLTEKDGQDILGKKITRVYNMKEGNKPVLKAERHRRGETTLVRYTVGRFLKDYKEGIYFLVVRKHAFTIIDGIVCGNYDDGIKTSTRIEAAFKVESKSK